MSEKELQSLMQRAHRSLRSARNLLDDGDHDFAMSRAYYAMFYGQRLVKTGKFSAEHQRVLQDAFTDRSAGDYAGVFPAREEVERRLVEADNFVQSIADFLKKQGAQL